LTKSLLAAAGVPVPRTLAVVHDFWDLQSIPRQLPHWYSFVLKPAMGSQGKGILVVHGRDGDDYLLAGGGRVSQVNLLKHIRDIIAGVYSNQGERDFALIESVLLPTPFYQQFYAPGLSDIRVILVQGQVMAAMLRVPTSHSNGKANLHQGAVGVPIDILSGKTGDGYLQGKKLAQHPDTGASFKGEQIPNWQRILEVARAAQQEIPLGYTGIDIADDVTQGPVVVEINARPGLEIQNVHGYGFADLVNTLAAYNLPDNPSPEGTG
ncbi:MAG: hypothetical protein OEZ23_04260, partial [Gammaproteobacteria bacterium]|nr:hypothetical protein [Gammaproteobacteria bacterium]